MKRLFVLLFVVLTCSMFAQNVQVHYDFGDGDEGEKGNREHFTTTVEMLKFDQWGSTFAFIDFDYNDNAEKQSASGAYWEITRMFNIPKVNGLQLGLQYNDGLGLAYTETYDNVSSGFGNVWLAGIQYPIDLKVVTLYTSLWVREAEGQDTNFQATVVWTKKFLEDQIVFTGFLDFWGQDNADWDEDGTDSQYVLLTEPQIWWDMPWVDQLSIGTEVEISKNFIYGANDDLKVCPTLGMKWEF